MTPTRRSRATPDPLELFHPAVRAWFGRSFGAPTKPQAMGWPAIAAGESTLILAPTGSGKTLAAFLWAIERVMFAPPPPPRERCRVLYVSPLKALAVDVERNLRAPLAGIAHVAEAQGDPHHVPEVAVRTGDTPAAERARIARRPGDILITTPESLYLMLTSNARDVLRSVDTVIVDEIHALAPTKRGAHLALSLERLEELRERPLQRIGLSATQRPLDEIARFLGGAATPRGRGRRVAAAPAQAIHDEFVATDAASWRPVTVIDTGERKPLALTVEVAVEDMARLDQPVEIPSGPAAQGAVRPSIWASIHPVLVEHVRAHRTTLVFVNSRRLAERLAGAINELAGETLARAHHGSIAREQRLEIEDLLKSGALRALVATSSLELGIDMGAVDLVIQIEAPPSVASGMQRIGRGGHQVGARSTGVLVPKFRGDLVACAAVARAMREGAVEATRFPRNPLDVLAQQIVAMAAMDAWSVDDLFAAVRRAAPFTGLARSSFEGVLDMLSGRYPSDDFADLRPRVTWDRVKGTIAAREGAKQVAITNGGTIPDRGLFGVFLAGAERSARVGELEEEMVFESRPGETFVLGASSWRIEEITHDRVLVTPAPGEPGKMPFWKGDGPGRPLEFGRKIGALVRGLRAMPRPAALEHLVKEHDLDGGAAENLMRYLDDQAEAAGGVVPDDRTVLVERVRDELGDWRVAVMTPFGGRVHAPWAMAVAQRVGAERGLDVESLWTDDGFVVRFPETDEPPDPALLLPAASEVESLVVQRLGSTALFAAKFREAAARALLLPRRRPGRRAPLWQQRKRAYDLLSVAARFGSFPIVLEAYREVLRDVFDLPALVETLRGVEMRKIRVGLVDSTTPSPFAASLLFGYVAVVEVVGDAPLAERRAQALALDTAQLRELLGEAELRELLDADVLDEVERRLQMLDPALRARSADGVHDLLLRLGDLDADELAARVEGLDAARTLGELERDRRAVALPIAGDRRWVPVEYAARYRDALGLPLPQGLPAALLAPAPRALADLARRWARTHGPFVTDALAARYALPEPRIAAVLGALAAEGALLEGEFRPGGTRREWCDPEVLRTIRQRSLARLRRQVEPVEPEVLGRFALQWQGVARPRRGLDALLDAVEGLQGAPLHASLLERAILPSRLQEFRSSDLDALVSAGEIVWAGLEPVGDRDGRLALYLTDHFERLWAPHPDEDLEPRARRILAHLAERGASFFAAIHDAAGGGFPNDTVDALWDLVWKGLVTNDSLHALRAFVAPTRSTKRGRRAVAAARAFRSRRLAPPAGAGRWSLVAARAGDPARPEARALALANQLLHRHGIVTREVASLEGIAGGFSAVYAVLRALEDQGKVRRGYFVTGVAATQFATPAALDLLRAMRDPPERAEAVRLAAADPANPYGALLPWPGAREEPGRGPTRTAGASVVLVNGRLGAWIGRGRQVLAFLPEDEPLRSTVGRAVAETLWTSALESADAMVVAEIDGAPAGRHALAAYLLEAGFVLTPAGLQARPRAVTPVPAGA